MGQAVDGVDVLIRSSRRYGTFVLRRQSGGRGSYESEGGERGDGVRRWVGRGDVARVVARKEVQSPRPVTPAVRMVAKWRFSTERRRRGGLEPAPQHAGLGKKTKSSEHKQDQTWMVLAFSVKRYISYASVALISSNEGFLCRRPANFVVDVLFAKPRCNASGNIVLVLAS